MSTRLIIPLVILSLSWAPNVAAVSQPMPAVTIFRLDDKATFQEGCFEPCDCKLMDELGIRGSFVLGPAVIGDAVDFHEVTEICWRVIGDDGSVVHVITGTGLYRITNFGPPQFHALDLDLSIDGAQPQHFFSDFVNVPNDGSLDMVVSINGIFCDDIVIRVDASTVPRILGDVNLDGVVNLLDVAPFVDRISTGTYQAEADINQDCVVNLLDVQPFIDLLTG